MTGIYVAASGVGGFLSRFLSGVLTEHFGWRASFFGLAVVTLACAVRRRKLMPRERRFLRSGEHLGTASASWRRISGTRSSSPPTPSGSACCSHSSRIFTYINFVLAAPPFLLSTAALGAIFVVYLVGVVLAAVDRAAGRSASGGAASSRWRAACGSRASR